MSLLQVTDNHSIGNSVFFLLVSHKFKILEVVLYPLPLLTYFEELEY